MSELKEYKCPSCTGVMNFDSSLQKMKCSYCDTVMSIEEYQEAIKVSATIPADESKAEGNSLGERPEGVEQETNWVSDTQKWGEDESSGMKVLSCQSCGGEIVASHTDITSVCPFCSNNVLITSQFAGDLKPDYCIPFKLNKEDAIRAYKKHLEGKSFLPRIFKEQAHIEEIKGIYVPFWIFDTNVYADLIYNASETRVWRSGDVEYTERKNYEIKRNGRIRFEHIPTDASRLMDDALMDSIEPYNFSEAVAFEPAYMAGYLANRYDVPVEECMARAKDRVDYCTRESFRNTVTGFANPILSKSHINIESVKYSYVLYPVWLLNTKWEGNIYTFAMNAQSGKLVGDLPLDKKAYWNFVIICGISITLIVFIIIFIIFIMSII